MSNDMTDTGPTRQIQKPDIQEIRVANLLLNSLELAFRYDLTWRGGRTVIDRQNVAVSIVQWALGQKEQL